LSALFFSPPAAAAASRLRLFLNLKKKAAVEKEKRKKRCASRAPFVPVDIDLLLCKSNNVDEAEAGHGQVKKKMVVVASQTIFSSCAGQTE
jgi:hypothetical protein